MMMSVVVQPKSLIQKPFANSPIFFFSPVKRISGQTANPSCMLSTTWLAMSSWVVFAFPENADHEHRRDDRDAARDQPPQPGRDAKIEKTFHHDLAGQRAGERRILPRGEQRHGEERARHAHAEQRAEQLEGVLDFRDVLVARPMKSCGRENEDGGVDEEREHERDGWNRSWRT